MRKSLVRSPVARLRREVRLTSLEAAKRAEISHGYLLKIEQGHTGASEQVVARLAALYGTTVEAVESAMLRARKTRLRYLKESLQ